MYEFVEIDGGWRIYWGPPAKAEEPTRTPPEEAVILTFVQADAQGNRELELPTAA